jgi:hypothetical protein
MASVVLPVTSGPIADHRGQVPRSFAYPYCAAIPGAAQTGRAGVTALVMVWECPPVSVVVRQCPASVM